MYICGLSTMFCSKTWIVAHYLIQPQPKPGVVIPMGPTSSQPVPPSPQSIHNIQVKTLPKPQPIQIKQEGGEVHLVDAN